MISWKLAIASAVALTFAGTVPAAAAVTLIGTKCVSVAASAGCLFSGNINPMTTEETEDDYNAVRNPDIDLRFIARIDDGKPSTFGSLGVLDENEDGEPLSGIWSLPGWNVDFIAVKAGTHFVLYQVTPGSSGSWDTLDLPRMGASPNPIGLSGIAFFGSPVPEPATWAMIIGGFGLVGGALRARRRGTVASA